jgi:hypothetical protein
LEKTFSTCSTSSSLTSGQRKSSSDLPSSQTSSQTKGSSDSPKSSAVDLARAEPEESVASMQIEKIHNITGLDLAESRILLALNDWDVQEAVRAFSGGHVLASMPPPPGFAPPKPPVSATAELERWQVSMVAKIMDVVGLDAEDASALLLAHEWDMERAVRAHVRSTAAEELDGSQEVRREIAHKITEEQVWGYYDKAWHPAEIYDTTCGGLLNIRWNDGTVSVLPDGLVARRSEHVQQGDSIIAPYEDRWYLASVCAVLTKEMIQVEWLDGTCAPVSRHELFKVPK